MSDLKPCPFCGCKDIEIERVGTSRASCIVVCTECGCKLESNETGAGRLWNTRAESAELATLREQVKVLREALQKLLEVNPVISFSRKVAFEYVSVAEKARLILKQTKPKDGE